MTKRNSKTIASLSKYLQRAKVPNAVTLATTLLVTPGYEHHKSGRDVLNITSKTAFGAALKGANGDNVISVTKLHEVLMSLDLVERLTIDGDVTSDRWVVAITKRLHDYRADYIEEISGKRTPTELKLELKKSQRATRDAKTVVSKLEQRVMTLEAGLTSMKVEQQAMWDAIRHIQSTDAPVTDEKIKRHLALVNG